MKRFVFAFTNDYHEDLADPHVGGFDFVDDSQTAALEALWDNDNDFYNDWVSDIEGDYGVHDVASTGEHEIIGYHSYEVPRAQQQELLERWRQMFITHGYAVGELVWVPAAQYDYKQLSMMESKR